MFDLSWSHIGLFIVIALLVLGPKELPNAIRTGAQLLRAGRKLAGEFRSGMDELMREAELDETRRSIKQAVTEGLDKTIEEHVDSTGELKGALENPAIETAVGEMSPSIAADPSKPGELAGPPNPGMASPTAPNVVINDPPPAPPNSIVPPPPEESVQPTLPAPEASPAPPQAADSAATDSEDLKKTA
jgi:sec-independent protein translocase protein TatB